MNPLDYPLLVLVLTFAILWATVLIGFNLLVGINRYDQRKSYEDAEANAIGTGYLRADFLPAGDAAKVRTLLLSYVDQRVLFYVSRDEDELRRISARTVTLQAALWAAVREPVAAQHTPVNALVAAGMNDVLNAQAYTQAAWWNRIPIGAWVLMCAIAICCNVLIGFGLRDTKAVGKMLLILPFIVSISFFLIADVDSARGGVIRVQPQNLQSLAASLRGN